MDIPPTYTRTRIDDSNQQARFDTRVMQCFLIDTVAFLYGVHYEVFRTALPWDFLPCNERHHNEPDTSKPDRQSLLCDAVQTEFGHLADMTYRASVDAFTNRIGLITNEDYQKFCRCLLSPRKSLAFSTSIYSPSSTYTRYIKASSGTKRACTVVNQPFPFAAAF